MIIRDIAPNNNGYGQYQWVSNTRVTAMEYEIEGEQEEEEEEEEEDALDGDEPEFDGIITDTFKPMIMTRRNIETRIENTDVENGELDECKNKNTTSMIAEIGSPSTWTYL